MATYSYRDPSAARTLDIYKELAEDLREFCESDEQIDKYIISTVARQEPVRSHLAESNARDAEWFCKIDEEYVRAHRREMLSATKADLLAYADVLERMATEGAVCVVGYDGVLSQCDGLEITSM
jgi:Zn-dependent M16 (insulinase) family peptidase